MDPRTDDSPYAPSSLMEVRGIDKRSVSSPAPVQNDALWSIQVVSFKTRVCVTPDHDSRGTEGRVYMKVPEQLKGLKFRSVGSFREGNSVILLVSDDKATSTVNERSILWWKNGVRDLGIRATHHAVLRRLRSTLLVLELGEVDNTITPDLPPYQPVLFGDG